MKFICNFLLILNYLAYFCLAVLAWVLKTESRFLFLLPLLLYPIMVFFAKKFAISKADKFFKSEWKVFLKEVKWSNTVILAIMLTLYWLFFHKINN